MFCLSQIYMVFGHTDLDHCITYVNIFETERAKVDTYVSFNYSADPLNFFDFKMNLIANSNKLKFCWNLISLPLLLFR